MNHPPYPPPYNQPPRPKGGLSGTALILIIVGSVVMSMGILVVALFGIAGYVGYKRAATRAALPANPLTVPLSESYVTPNKLLTAHYPADFAAKTLDHATLILSRNFGDGTDEVVTLAGVSPAITNDPHEFGRLLLALVDKNVAAKGGTSTKTSEREAMCLGIHPGVEVEGGYEVPGTAPYQSKACFFLLGNRGYEVRYDAPRSRSAGEVPLLERIVEATELAP